MSDPLAALRGLIIRTFGVVFLIMALVHGLAIVFFSTAWVFQADLRRGEPLMVALLAIVAGAAWLFVTRGWRILRRPLDQAGALVPLPFGVLAFMVTLSLVARFNNAQLALPWEILLYLGLPLLLGGAAWRGCRTLVTVGRDSVER